MSLIVQSGLILTWFVHPRLSMNHQNSDETMKTFIIDLNDKRRAQIGNGFIIQVDWFNSAPFNQQDLGSAGLFVLREAHAEIQRMIDEMLDSNSFKDDEQETTEVDH